MTLSKRLQAVAALMAQTEADRADSPEDIDAAVARLTGFMHSRAYNEEIDVIPQPENGWQGWTHTGHEDCPRCEQENRIYWQATTRALVTAVVTIREDRKDPAPIPWRRWSSDACVTLPCRAPTYDTITVGE